ncbi:hypothetical protein D9M68_910270 [compost metagenome]
MVFTSSSWARKFGSMRGGAMGSADFRPRLPTLFGRNTHTWQLKPWPQCSLRLWSSMIATTAFNWTSGRARPGFVLRKPPLSAKLVANGPRLFTM